MKVFFNILCITISLFFFSEEINANKLKKLGDVLKYPAIGAANNLNKSKSSISGSEESRGMCWEKNQHFRKKGNFSSILAPNKIPKNKITKEESKTKKIILSKEKQQMILDYQKKRRAWVSINRSGDGQFVWNTKDRKCIFLKWDEIEKVE